MSHSPAIILVRPQLVENIGMTARAMANCALGALRIVSPRDPWPLPDILQKRMEAASSGADSILKAARLFNSVEEAIADLNYVYATTARTHDMVTTIMTPAGAIPDMVARATEGQAIGILFGPERTGLVNDDIVLANAKITIPLNPDFMSLNLAQTVLLMGYEWFKAQDATPPVHLHDGNSRPATREEYLNFYRRLEEALDAAGFFVAEHMRPTMTRSLQAMLQRAAMTEQEVRTWQGVLTALARGPVQGRKKDNAS